MADKSGTGIPQLPKFKTYWIYVAVVIALFGYQYLGQSGPKLVTMHEFEKNLLLSGDVEKIEIINLETAEIYIEADKLNKPAYKNKVKVIFGDTVKAGPHFYVNIGSAEIFEKKLEEAREDFPIVDGIPVNYVNRKNWLGEIAGWILPIVIIVVFWMFMMRRVQGGQNGTQNMFNFGKSKATLYEKDKVSKIGFDQVAGIQEAKTEIKEIVDFLQKPEDYTKLGAKIPKGVILVGPPGTGKTLLAKAVAGEANVPFFTISGSDFVEMFVGVGASRVRDLFEKAKAKAPSIIFIDEIDAIGRSRGRNPAFGSNDERENTLNQLLTEMDGFEVNAGVIVLAATNRADILDPALLRPGRFDRHIYLELPNLEEREGIFKVHMKPLILSSDVEPALMAKQTPGFSGADIANICNEAALIAARGKKEEVSAMDFSLAIDRVIAGLERKSKIISPQEKKIVSFHEAGHAVVSWYLENAPALFKVTIIPRGKSLGAAWYLPEERNISTRSQLLDQLCVALGGRAAEEIIFNEVSSGAMDDLEKVTKQAYAMVSIYGLDSVLGNICYYDSTGKSDHSFQKPYSEETAKLIDERVRFLIDEAYEKAKAIIREHHTNFEALANLLLEKETVNKDDLVRILGCRENELV